MAFAAINKQFTLQAFTAYLAALPRPTWAKGSTYHNTFVPTEAQWRGLSTMQGMQAHYESLGWSSGPHCFLALGAPNPAHDGIWIMTPPTAPGTHAGACNADHFGIEVVGDFHSRSPSLAQQQLLIDTLAALHHWAGIGAILNAHRDCMAGRTCPGDAFYRLKPYLQAGLADALTPNPLRARQLPSPPGHPVHYCSVAVADFYKQRGDIRYCGYALADEFWDTSLNCGVLRCERVIIKESTQYGVEQALLSEARAEGWLP